MKVISCLVRVNTKELRNSLENIGYRWWSCDPEDSGIVILTTDDGKAIYSGIHGDPEDYVNSGFIDCGDNTGIFLVLARAGHSISLYD